MTPEEKRQAVREAISVMRSDHCPPDYYEQDTCKRVKSCDYCWATYLSSLGVMIAVEGVSDDLAKTASESPAYYAPGVGLSSERTTHIFRAFKQAGYVKAIPLIDKEGTSTDKVLARNPLPQEKAPGCMNRSTTDGR